MLKKTDKTCPLTDEIVSYLYGELVSDTEHAFEAHLAECGPCTDEFAAIAEQRYSVFEWKKEAFDTLPTPRFAIPFEAHASRPGPIAAIMAWAESLSIPLAVAAGLAVFLGIGMFFSGYFAGEQTHIAANTQGPPIEAPRPADIEVAVEPLPVSAPGPAVIKPAAPRPIVARRPVRRTPRPATRPEPNLDVTPDRAVAAQRLPALTPYQEPDDDSLRLTDLFDDVGG